MDQTERNVGTQAERLTQLANLHSQGLLSDEDYAAATARLVGGRPREQQASPVLDERTAPVLRGGSPTSSFDGSVAASYLAMLLIGVNIVMAVRMIDNSAYEDDRLLGGITYPWAFLLCAGLWLVAVLVLRQTRDSVTKGIVVGIAILTAMVLVAAYGTDSLPLLLNAFVLVAVGVNAGSAESP